jgi:hypothetical protein
MDVPLHGVRRSHLMIRAEEDRRVQAFARQSGIVDCSLDHVHIFKSLLPHAFADGLQSARVDVFRVDAAAWLRPCAIAVKINRINPPILNMPLGTNRIVVFLSLILRISGIRD